MSLGDSEHPISFRFEPTHQGGHVHVKVRAGQAGMRADCGTLVMRMEEWAVLRAALATYPFEPLELVALPAPSWAQTPGTYYKQISVEPFEITP